MQPAHWRCYMQDWPDPDPATALRAPVRAFPSWLFHATCDRCRREAHLSQVDFLVAGKGKRLVIEIVCRLVASAVTRHPIGVDSPLGSLGHTPPSS